MFRLQAEAFQVYGKVIKVKDGDTFVLLSEDQNQYIIRLAYVDCPEKGQAFFQTAKSFTARMVLGSHIRCEILGKEKYKRYLAIAYLPGNTKLNEMLLRQGLAWVYHTYQQNGRLNMLQQKARKEKRGIWSEKAPIAPWLFRNRHSQGAIGIFNLRLNQIV